MHNSYPRNFSFLSLVVCVLVLLFMVQIGGRMHNFQTHAASTTLAVTVYLHGIGKGGDSTNATGGGNSNPNTKTVTVSVGVFNVQNVLVASRAFLVTYNAANGNFTGSGDFGILGAGVYTVVVRADKYLQRTVDGIQTIKSGTTNQLPPVVLISGDIDNNNQINITDYNILMGCYSDLIAATNCTAGQKKAADLTDDGNVNQLDYNLFVREISNRSGATNPTIAPTLKPTAAITPTTAPSATAPTLLQEFSPWNGVTSPDSAWRIAGTWVGTGNNTLDPANAILSSTYNGASGGYLSLTSRANKLNGGEMQSLGGYGYGYYEVRMKVTNVPGVVASFFWIEEPNYGPHEWDIEFLTKEASTVHYTIHPSETAFIQTLPFNQSSDFHRYGFLWTPGKIAYTVDGAIVHTFTDASLTTSAKGFIMMNSWTGNANFGGGPPTQDGTTVYDWVKYYANATSIPK